MRLFPLCAAAAIVVACAPQPSTKPLGWGPLQPGMQGASAPVKHAAARSNPPRAASAAKSTASAEPEAASAASEKPSSESPAGSASSAPSKDSHPEGAKAKVAVAAFVGDYTGEDVATYRVENTPDRTEKDPKARMTVTSSSDTALAFELVDSSNGKEICTLNGTLGESSASIAKGQKCFEQSGEDASTAATVISGTATVEKTRLVFDLDMSFSMEIADRKLGGTLAYHFDGTRK